MRSAFALRINSGKNIFIVVTLENLRIFQSYFFTKGVQRYCNCLSRLRFFL